MKTVRLFDPLLSSTFPLALIAIVALAMAAACGGASGPEPASTPTPTATVPDEEPDPTSAPETTVGSTRDWNVLGSPDALVTVLDYSDFQ